MELDQVTHERETTDPDPEMWRWSPLELAEFDRMLLIATNLIDGRRYCEAGSGIGTKLYLAKNYYNLQETGFEISWDYLGASDELGVEAYWMDFREATPVWRDYDIIYCGRPFKEDSVESAFEQGIMDGMAPGAVLIMAWTSNKPYSWPCYYRAPFRGVWQKPKFKTSVPVYDAMIKRQEPYDPLVPMPVGYPG
jgi:hypothetical protein